MSSEEPRGKVPYVIHTVPLNVDPKTWAEVQSKWVEVRLKEVEVERERTKAFVELIREGMNSLQGLLPEKDTESHITSIYFDKCCSCWNNYTNVVR